MVFGLYHPENNSVLDISLTSQLNFRSCLEAAERYYFWVLVLLILPTVISCGSLAISIATIIHVRRLKSVTEAIISSTHWLARTANRIGLGSSAHNALIEYAKKKNLLKLVQINEPKHGDAHKLRNSCEQPQ